MDHLKVHLASESGKNPTGLYLSVPDLRADILVSEYTSTGKKKCR